MACRTVRLARSFYVWAEAVAGRREGDVAAACSAEAAAGAASAALEARINSLEQQRCLSTLLPSPFPLCLSPLLCTSLSLLLLLHPAPARGKVRLQASCRSRLPRILSLDRLAGSKQDPSAVHSYVLYVAMHNTQSAWMHWVKRNSDSACSNACSGSCCKDVCYCKCCQL